MNIGTASEKSGLPAKTIRNYEDIGLISPDRRDNGYRDYSMHDMHRLRFLQRPRGLGFPVEQCRQPLSLHSNRERESAEDKTIAIAKLGEIESKINELQGLHYMLSMRTWSGWSVMQQGAKRSDRMRLLRAAFAAALALLLALQPGRFAVASASGMHEGDLKVARSSCVPQVGGPSPWNFGAECRLPLTGL